MSCLYYKDDELYIENVPLHAIATTYDTPCFVYSRAMLEQNWQTFENAFAKMPHLICYAVKANGNLAILNLLARANSGFDIVSRGELARVIAAGGDPKKIIFSGIGKKHSEIEDAISKNIYCFDIESALELERIAAYAMMHTKQIKIALRINPNIDPHTHAHIATGLNENKFGIELKDILPLAVKIKTYPNLKLIGIACHIGSQITTLNPFAKMLDCLVQLYQQLRDRDIEINHINIGGGLGITYKDESPPSINEYAKVVQEKLGHLPITLITEPGRSIVGNAGALLTRVEYLKHNGTKNFAIVDAGMNDLLRPALYSAWQAILPVKRRSNVDSKHYDIVGPVCESADFLGKNRELAIIPNDILAIDCAGAYGFSMSSNYNSRERAAEVLVDGDEAFLVRRRETIKELFALEKIIYRNLVT